MRWEPHDRGTSSAAPAPGPLVSGRVGGGPRGAGVEACTALPSNVPGFDSGRAARLDAGRDDRGDLGAAASGPVDMKTWAATTKSKLALVLLSKALWGETK